MTTSSAPTPSPATESVVSRRTELLVPNLIEKPTVSVEEAGRILGISRASAYEAVKAGEVPSLRLGRRIVVPTAGLLRLLDGQPETDVNVLNRYFDELDTD